jgi:hypothetical protein
MNIFTNGVFLSSQFSFIFISVLFFIFSFFLGGGGVGGGLLLIFLYVCEVMSELFVT